MTTSFRLLMGLLLGGSLLTCEPVVFAQSADYYARLDSTRAYWKLKADQSDQKPVVQFYNSHHKLLYQEPLVTTHPITEQMQQVFDRLLVQLTTNRLLATAYLAHRETTSLSSVSSLDKIETLKQVKFRKGVAVFWVDPAISQTGKLTIVIAQQSRKLIKLILEDENHNLNFFEDMTTLPAHKWVLNLDQLPDGHYYIRVGLAESAFVYRLTIDRDLNLYALQVQKDQPLRISK